ncbi:MAG: queuosine precursor transporter [Deltaproteobacteria bacterium]|jgi:uncharacterized integral membrane protein (TIGR00697 family)|nr:queuosine precursor transporter [Deltaproteobacteria bacterium]
MRSRELFPLLLCSGIFCACLVAAAVLAAKIVRIGPVAVPAGVFAYCVTFVCADVISEIWGRRCANMVVLTGFVGLALTFGLVQLALWCPAAPFWDQEDAFHGILGMTPRIIAASLAAYLLSQFHDVWLYNLLKDRMRGRHLWLRNNLATILSQLIDSVVFIAIAFYGVMPLWPLIVGQWAVKATLALCDTPLVYAAVWCIRRRMGAEETY